MKVFIAAEGPSEIGDLARSWTGATKQPREGYFQPMLRKLLGPRIELDGRKIALLGRLDSKKKLAGHADRAAKALAIARQIEGCEVLVFVKDVDRAPGTKKSAHERRKKMAEMHEQIEAGFAAVSGTEHIVKLKATPCRMIEAWALGDRAALESIAGRDGDLKAIPARPEEAWGDESDLRSNHPKNLLSRALGSHATDEVFSRIAELSLVETLCETCPESFAPFANEAMVAGPMLR